MGVRTWTRGAINEGMGCPSQSGRAVRVRVGGVSPKREPLSHPEERAGLRQARGGEGGKGVSCA